MAHKKGVGSSDNGRDSISKRLGVKLFGGQLAKAGNIIIRQRGTKYHPGENVYMGKDHTIHAAVDGTITFNKRKNNRTFVSIQPLGQVAETVAKVPQAKKEAPKKAVPAKPIEAMVSKPIEATGSEADDLKKIEGIGPKIEQIFNGSDIKTFAQLAATPVDQLKSILEAAGNRYKAHDPTTWPQQAQMAADGKWAELKKWQDELDGGKEVKASTEEE